MNSAECCSDDFTDHELVVTKRKLLDEARFYEDIYTLLGMLILVCNELRALVRCTGMISEWGLSVVSITQFL